MGGNSDEKSPDESQVFVRIAVISVVLAFGCGRDSPGDRAAVGAVGDDAARSLALCARIDLGVLVQGEKTLRRQWVENRRGAAVRVGRIESSCECLTVDLAQSAVEPGVRVLAEFRYDGSKEPDFVGSLMIEVEVWDDSETKVGRFEVAVEVIADQKAE